jgi:hypothetical protein
MRIVRNVARIFLWIFAIATFISMLGGPLFAVLLLVSEPPRSCDACDHPYWYLGLLWLWSLFGAFGFGWRIGRYPKRVPSRRA